MYKTDAIAYFGSVTALANVLGIHRQAVHQWGELVPECSAYKLHVLTNRRLKLDRSLYAH